MTPQEHLNLMEKFEAKYQHLSLGRSCIAEQSEHLIYINFTTNELFSMYRDGYIFGTTAGPEATALRAAPVVVVDTQRITFLVELGTVKEAHFPLLYALHGHRVALVDLEPVAE